nr:reverse transcriptase domain-containing protein [Tanacetum cinerariifolium]
MMEYELWNLTVKNNDLPAYTQRFQELTMKITKMVSEEEDRVEKFIGDLPDNIQGNVIAAELVTDINKRTKSKSKPDKTKHGTEKSGKVKVNQKVNQVKVKNRAEVKELLNGPTRTHLMGRVSPFTQYKDL